MAEVKKLEKHKIHPSSILKVLGIILHVPAIMGFSSLIIAAFYEEYFAFMPLLGFGFTSLIVGQILYRCYAEEPLHNLWEAMIGAALGWALCSIIGALPYFLISQKLIALGLNNEPITVFSRFINCMFESFSGFTSTGLTMTSMPSKLTHVLQWWRSFQAWIGGMGLIVFIIAVVEPKKEEYRLYLAEAKNEHVGKHINITLRKTWLIYLAYTLGFIFLFYLAKMPFWDAVNHGMNCIATGGFSIADKNLAAYSLSAQIVAIFGMTIGAISFSLHYLLFKERKFSLLWYSLQHRLLFIFLVVGSLLTLLINYFPKENISSFACIFSWFTSLTTCGFSNTNISYFSAASKLFLILAMTIGGASGSTAGGLKIRRVMNLFSAILLRLKSLTKAQEEEIIERVESKEEDEEQEIAEIKLPASEKTAKIYSSVVLFFLWIFFLILGWLLILLIKPDVPAVHALFNVSSAFSNVGLFTTDIVNSSLASSGKLIFIFLMWLGRLEIIPFIVLISAFFSLFTKKEAKKKHPTAKKAYRIKPQ